LRRAGLRTVGGPRSGGRNSEGGESRIWSGVLNAVVSMVGHLGQAWRGAPERVIAAAAGNALVQDPAPAVDPPRRADLLASGLVTGGVSASVIRTEAVGESHLTRRRPPEAVAVAANRRAVIGVER
jgi:hypothetical protein